MEYIGFIFLLLGAAGMDGNPLIAGVVALIGAVILFAKGGKME